MIIAVTLLAIAVHKTNNLELRHGTACGARQQQFDDSDDVEYDALPIRFHTLSL